MIVIRKEYSQKEQNIYCSNKCFNNSVEYKKYDKDYARFQSFHEIYTSENYPTITELLSVDKFEYCSTCETRISEQDFHVNKSIEIIDKKIFSEENQALLGKHIDDMRDQLIDEDFIEITEDFYDGVYDLYKEFMQKMKEYKENK